MTSEDARFEDGGERPLNLGAVDAEDLKVISSLCQDAVFPITELSFARRRFAVLLNRFRWEEAGRARHAPERVQSVLKIEDVLTVSSQGIDRNDHDTILSLLTVTFEPEEDGMGTVLLTLSGDGALRLEVETLNVEMRDVTRPYVAPSGSVPGHD